MKYEEIVSWCANLKDYILITPVKNEEQMVHGVAECIIRQTQQPLCWVIIDGNSSTGVSRFLKTSRNHTPGFL